MDSSPKRPSESPLPDEKRRVTDYLWLVDPLSRVHCLQTGVILTRAPNSYWARLARNPGTMSQEEPLFVSMPPWFVEAITSWAQEFGPQRVHFSGHAVAEVTEILDKLSYAGEADGDVPIDPAYLPPQPKSEHQQDLIAFVELLKKVMNNGFHSVYYSMLTELEYNRAYKCEFKWQGSSPPLQQGYRRQLRELLAKIEARRGKPLLITELSGYPCQLSISVQFKPDPNPFKLAGDTDMCDYLCVENTPVPVGPAAEKAK